MNNNARLYIDTKVKQLAPSRKMVISAEMLSEAFADEAEVAAYFISAGCHYLPASLSRDGLARVMRPSDYLAAGRCSRAFTDDPWAQAGETASLSPDAHSQIL